MTDSFSDRLKRRQAELVEKCTQCGDCFKVCPMTEPAGLQDSDPALVTNGIIEFLTKNRTLLEAKRWAEVCSGSGTCIPVCQHGVNPRFMLSLVRLRQLEADQTINSHRQGGEAFSAMSRGVRILSQLQLSPELQAQLHTERERSEPPEVIFYTGCQVLKTPHIALLCLDMLDALNVDYEVFGGPRDCCGVLQYRTGDVPVSGRIGNRTTDRFRATGTKRVLSWCPTCQVQLGENLLPEAREDLADDAFSLIPFVCYLAENLESLKPLLVNPVKKKVGLHEHPGVGGVTEAARSLLEAIPGLQYIDLQQPRVGWMCNTLQPLPEYKRRVHSDLLTAAAEAGVDTLAGVYHACHRELCSHERDWPFDVVNFLELVGESMGLFREDRFKRLKILGDIDSVMVEVGDQALKLGMDLDQVRKVLAKDLLGQ